MSLSRLVLKDGAHLGYAELGGRAQSAPQRQDVLFVHGWAAHGGFFAPLIQALPSHWRSIVPDLRGHGGSREAGPAGLSQMADDLNDLIAACEGRDMLAVGWSMGASVLWHMIERHGGARLKGLVVIDMSPKILNDGAWALGLKGGFDAAASDQAMAQMRSDWGAFCLRIAANVLSRSEQTPSGLFDWLLDEFRRNDPAMMADAWSSLAAFDARGAITAIDLPTLVIHGAQSRLYDAETADFVTRAQPCAIKAAFGQSGHAPHLEETERFARLLERFAGALAVGAGEWTADGSAGCLKRLGKIAEILN